jgi:hypothetical protein
MDFLVHPSVRFRLLYAWFVIGHGRREIIHFGVIGEPNRRHSKGRWPPSSLRVAASGLIRSILISESRICSAG